MLFRGRDPYSQQVSSRKWGEASDISPVSGREWEPIAIKGGYPRKCSWRGMLGWDLLDAGATTQAPTLSFARGSLRCGLP